MWLLTFDFARKDSNDYGYHLHLIQSCSEFFNRQVTESTGFKTDLLIPLLPQDVRCYHKLFYMTTHISAAQMLPLPILPASIPLPPPAASLHLWLLLQHPIH